MDRQKKRLSSALTALSADVARVADDVGALERRAGNAVGAALRESDPALFKALHDAAKREIEKVRGVWNLTACWVHLQATYIGMNLSVRVTL